MIEELLLCTRPSAWPSAGPPWSPVHVSTSTSSSTAGKLKDSKNKPIHIYLSETRKIHCFRDSETHAESTEINQNKRKWGRTTFPEKSSVQFRLWQNPPAAWASPALHITCLLVNRQPAGQNCQDGGSFPYDTHWNDLTRWSEYLKWSTRGCKLTLSQPRKCGAALFLEKGAWATLGHGHMEGGSSRAHTGHIGVVLTWTPSRSSTQVQAYETVIWRTLLGITEWTSVIKFSSLLEEKVLQKL